MAGHEIKGALAKRETEKILFQSRRFSFRETLFRRLYKKVKQKRMRRKKKYEGGRIIYRRERDGSSTHLPSSCSCNLVGKKLSFPSF